MRDRLRYVEVRCHDPEGAVQTWQALAESGKADTGLSYAYDYVAVSGSTVQWLSTDACAFEGIFREGEELLRSVLAAGGAPPAHVLTCACGQPCAPEQPAL